ncbi:hypothetical protein CcaverHIS631_0105790 [Cutaneotrichosporon cavernicola]|nr:hypothetical protein CcaverHIS631_0105790 [Cutaneotrichosporon cavernicola]
MTAGYVPLATSPRGSASALVDDRAAPEVDEAAVVVLGEDTVTPFVWALVCAAAISGLLFGYDTGVISGTLVVIGTDLGAELTTHQKEAITSATTLGALFGGLGAGALSDARGRKGVLFLANIVFIVGALLQAAAHAVSTMVVGRFIVGLGVGLASCIAPLYIGELAPTRMRGRLVTVNAVVCTFGQVVAYTIGALFARAPGGWRWMVGLGALPAAVQLASLGFLPESPRILLLRGDTRAVERVLARVYPLATKGDVARKVEIMARAVAQSVEIEKTTTMRQRAASLFRVGAYRRALVIGCGLQALQQACGFNTLMYYSASIFAAMGFKNATATGLIIATVNCVFTLVALKIIDPIGRRPIMLYTVPLMALALFSTSFFFGQLTHGTDGVLVPGTEYPRSQALLVLLSMMFFVAAYATGSGNIPWQQGELFPLEVRGLGTSLCTATNWSVNLLVAATFLSLMEAATPAGAFALYAVVCLRQHHKERLAGAFRIFARLGYDEGVAGHITVRDVVNPHAFWVNPYGVAFDQMTASDLLLIDHDGNVLGGGKDGDGQLFNAAGFAIHGSIHRQRQDIHAAAHSHSYFGRAFSCLGRNIDLASVEGAQYGETVRLYDDFGGVVLDDAEGLAICKALGPAGKGAILQNHGILTAAGTVDAAVAYFVRLERLCQAQLEADAAGGPRVLTDSEVHAVFAEQGGEEVAYEQAQELYEWLEAVDGQDYKL